MNRTTAQKEIRQELQQGCFHLLLFLLCCGIIAGAIGAYKFLRDPVVQEARLDETCSVQVQAETGWWEICIWVHLTIRRKGMGKTHSAPIACYDPHEIEAKNLHLAIEKIGDIGMVYDTREPEKLLALFGLDTPIVYPAVGIQEAQYYVDVQNMLCAVKNRTRNNNLQLERELTEYSCGDNEVE